MSPIPEAVLVAKVYERRGMPDEEWGRHGEDPDSDVLYVWEKTEPDKWGQEQRKAVTDARLRRVVEECRDLPGYEVFKYLDEGGKVRDVKSRDLNAYVKEVVGPQFTAKDFRTWAGTLIAASTLAGLGASEDAKAAQKNVLAAVDEVPRRLGNTRDIARVSYISPRVIDHYI